MARAVSTGVAHVLQGREHAPVPSIHCRVSNAMYILVQQGRRTAAPRCGRRAGVEDGLPT
jgi:hypothetical protein